MRIRRSSRRSSLTSATSRSRSGGDRPAKRRKENRSANWTHACHGIRSRGSERRVISRLRVHTGISSRKAMTVEPNRFELGGRRVKTAVASRSRSHRENAAPHRDGRSATRVRSAMGDNEFDLTMGSTMQLYQGDVGLQPVLQIAGACLARETKRLAWARPLGTLRGARVTRAAHPRRLQRSRRVRSACGFPRSADRPPPIPPPRRSSRAREQDRRR